MEEKITFRPFIVPALILSLGGWGSLYLLLNFSFPTLLPRWAFFALLMMAASGTAIPIVFIFNKIFLSDKPILLSTIIRQSVMVGIYPALLAWLSIGRILDFSISVWLAVGIIMIEYLIQLRQSFISTKNVPQQPPIS